MATYKPVGVDTTTSRFPPRVEAALGQLFSRRVRRGFAKGSGGIKYFGLPSTSFSGVTTAAQAAGEVRYSLLEVRNAITLSALQFEITTGPTAAANVAIGIYAADENHQPTGAPLYASASVSVASGFTGVKAITGLSVTLQPGLYLVSTNVDQAMTARVFVAPGQSVVPELGATPFVGRYRGTQTYSVAPATPTQWVDGMGNALGSYHMILAQWAEI